MKNKNFNLIKNCVIILMMLGFTFNASALALQPSQTDTVITIGDTFLRSTRSTTKYHTGVNLEIQNFGTSTTDTLAWERTQQFTALVKFDISAYSAPVTEAYYSAAFSKINVASGFDVFKLDSAWEPTDITWDSAPKNFTEIPSYNAIYIDADSAKTIAAANNYDAYIGRWALNTTWDDGSYIDFDITECLNASILAGDTSLTLAFTMAALYEEGTSNKYNRMNSLEHADTTPPRLLITTPLVTGVTLDEEYLELVENTNTTLTATIAPEGALDMTVVWSSSDESIATVVDGVVSAIAAGTADIYATTNDGGFSDTCMVTVVVPSKTDTVITIGDTFLRSAKPGNKYYTGVNLEIHNYGTSTTDALAWERTQQFMALVKFDISAYTKPVTKASYSAAFSNINVASGMDVFKLDSAWEPTDITWGSAPQNFRDVPSYNASYIDADSAKLIAAANNYDAYIGRWAMNTSWDDGSYIDFDITNCLNKSILAGDTVLTLAFTMAELFEVGANKYNRMNSMEHTALTPPRLLVTTPLPAVGDMFTVDNINYTLTNLMPQEVEVAGFADVAAGVADLVIPAIATDPSNMEAYSVVAVGGFCCNTGKTSAGVAGNAGNNVVTTVALPASVKAIADFTFANNDNLTTVNLEDVVTIGKAAFTACGSLNETGILSSCTFIGDYSFNLSFRNLTSFECPVLETMGAGAIYDSAKKGTSLVKINIPNTLTSVGTLFLGGHTNLTAVQVNWTAEGLDTVTFADTDKFFRWLDKTMITVLVPVGTKAAYEAHALWGTFPADNIVEGAFPAIGDMFTVDNIKYTLTNLMPQEVEVSGFADVAAGVADLVIPATATDTTAIFEVIYDVVSVGGFSCNAAKGGGNAGNNVIETVSLPSSVVSIAAHAFRQNANLTTINLDNVQTLGSNAFVICPLLSDIGSLASVITTNGYAFYQCKSLTSIEMPSVVTLGSGEIYDMDGIVTFNVPSTVTTIGTLFLGRNDALKTVQVNWTDTTSFTINPENFFRGMTLADITLYVPVGTKAMYEAHSLWGTFPAANIVEGEILPVTGVMLNAESVELLVSTDTTLKATIAPEGAYDMSVVWGSSDATVATVVDGMISAVAVGTAKIYVTTNDGGFSDTCMVTVVAPASLSETGMNLVTVYPNPSMNGIITIDGEAGQMMDLVIYSISGAKVFEKSVLTSQSVNTELTSGIYMLSINKEQIVKLVIE